MFNTFYNCRNVFNVGYQGGNDLAPLSTTIAHNVIFAANSTQTGVLISDQNNKINWKNNLMYQGRFQNFSPQTEQFARTTANLNFQASDAEYLIYKPTAQSIITSGYKTTEYPQIQTDLEGKNRPSERMIGAYELNGAHSINMPTPKTIGCSFINKETTGLFQPFQQSNNIVKNIRSNGSILFVESDYNNFSVRIYNAKGVLTSTLKNLNGKSSSFRLPDNLYGLYIFIFDNGRESQSVKLII